ncbi:MAG: tRNA-guanine transglycosylase, partial [Microgenomates group bacterium]
PTRLGRMGHLLVQGSRFKVQGFTIDITKAEFAKDKGPIDERCDCFVCKNYHRAYLHHLFRAKELLAYRLATYHNLYFLERLMQDIRLSVKKGRFKQLKEEWLGQ